MLNVILDCVSDPSSSKYIVLTSEPLVIGRKLAPKILPAPDNGIFDSKVLSRNHAEMWEHSGNIWIKDNNSSNGTFVNGVSISKEGKSTLPTRVNNHDVIDFGIDIPDDQGNILYKRISCKVIWIDAPSSEPLQVNNFESLNDQDKIKEIFRIICEEVQDTEALSRIVHEFDGTIKHIEPASNLQVLELSKSLENLKSQQDSVVEKIQEIQTSKNDLIQNLLTKNETISNSDKTINILNQRIEHLENNFKKFVSSVDRQEKIEESINQIRERMADIVDSMKINMENCAQESKSQKNSILELLSEMKTLQNDSRKMQNKLNNMKRNNGVVWVCILGALVAGGTSYFFKEPLTVFFNSLFK